jgi:hypothetical protein
MAQFLRYTFGSYKNPTHYDWILGGFSVDAPSYLLTGFLSGGDYQRDKQAIYMTVHCARTEDDGVTLSNQSSCLTQIQWDWTNSTLSGRWTVPFQAYRLKIAHGTANPHTYAPSYNVVETRNKIRGVGKVVSVLYNSEPGKHLTIYGWSINMGIDGNV